MKRLLKIESGLINNISSILEENDMYKKILYVSDPFVDSKYGGIVKKQIENKWNLKIEMVDNNTISYAMQLAERVIATDIDCIIALGGGKVLDVCKYASYISKKPLLSIPTTVANDGIVSPIAVLKRQDSKPKSLGCKIPSMVCIDIDIIMESPIELIKAGIGDTISNYMALLDWEYACMNGMDTMNSYAYIMSKMAFDALVKTQYTSICREFIDVLINSLVLSGIAMDFAGSSRPVSGSEHLFSHALDYHSKVSNLHGIQVALGTISILKLLDFDYSEILSYLRRFEVDINPLRLNIDQETFIYCMQNAKEMRPNRFTYLNTIDLSREKLKKTYIDLVKEL